MEDWQQTSEWLEQHTGHSILIHKEEQGDLDTVEVQLERIGSKQEAEQVVDEYTDGNALLLHGTGSVVIEQERHPLPGGMFIIPLKGLSGVSLSDKELRFQTERAAYQLIKQ